MAAACTSGGYHAQRADPPSDPPTTAAPVSAPLRQPSDSRRVPHARLHPRAVQLTRAGMWWGVDSTSPIDAAALTNVRDWYRGRPTPLLWGRYLTGRYRLVPGELAFAARHDIGVYFLVPDGNCSQCNGADACGNDRTAAQARVDARDAADAARRAGLPPGIVLWKDIEQVSSCSGELTTVYLLAWFRSVDRTRYRAGFYGNTNRQNRDFARAFCPAVRREPDFAARVPLAQDEPEPQFAPQRGEIGPRNAPRFAPNRPRCAPTSAVRIWQYSESVDDADSTDTDEIRPGTHGLLAPGGGVT